MYRWLYCAVEEDTLLQIETAVTERLVAGLSDVQIVPYPDDPNELGKPVRKATLFVGIKDDNYSAPQTFNKRAPLIQQGSIRVEFLLRAVNLRTHQVAYPYRQKIHSLISKFSPLEGQENKWFYYKSGGLTILDQGVWGLVMVYELPHVLVTK